MAGRFEVSGGVANLRRLIVDTPRMVAVGGGYLALRAESWEFILAPEARDNQNAALASPLRLKGGTNRATEGTLEPGLSKLIVGGGVVPSLVAQVTQAGRQPGANACAVVAPRIDGLRPGLRAQLPTPSADVRRGPRRPPVQTRR
jgi:AsmA family protein